MQKIIELAMRKQRQAGQINKFPNLWCYDYVHITHNPSMAQVEKEKKRLHFAESYLPPKNNGVFLLHNTISYSHHLFAFGSRDEMINANPRFFVCLSPDWLPVTFETNYIILYHVISTIRGLHLMHLAPRKNMLYALWRRNVHIMWVFRSLTTLIATSMKWNG